MIGVPKPHRPTEKEKLKLKKQKARLKKAKSPSVLKKKCIDLAKKIVRMQGYCDKCGRKDRQLHGAHVLSVRHEATCADPDNIMCLCAYCHKLGSDSWHEEPMENSEWFKQKWPGRWERLWKKAHTPTKYINYEVLLDQLKERLKELENV